MAKLTKAQQEARIAKHVETRVNFATSSATAYGALVAYASDNDSFFDFPWSLVAFNKNAETNGVSEVQQALVKEEHDACKQAYVDAGGDPADWKKKWGQAKEHSQWKKAAKEKAKAQVTAREKLLGHLRKAYNLASDPEAGAKRGTLDALTTALLAEGIDLEEV